jgi:hypothetical protein
VESKNSNKSVKTKIMETKKLKKLSINKMHKFPVVSEQEQMTLKGGTIPPWVFTLLAELAVDYILSSGDNESNEGNGNYGGSGSGSGNVNIQIGGSDNTIIINGEEHTVSDSIFIEAADSIANGTIYNPTGITIVGN